MTKHVKIDEDLIFNVRCSNCGKEQVKIFDRCNYQIYQRADLPYTMCDYECTGCGKRNIDYIPN